MKLRSCIRWLLLPAAIVAHHASASDLSYTFVDFQAVSSDTAAEGTLLPVPTQSVTIKTENGDGIAIAGALAIGSRFYFGGNFQSSIIDVDAVVTNPLGTTTAKDTFDLVHRRLAFGYKAGIGENFDLVVELSGDSAEYDFGSFAGEAFDTEEHGVGASFGFRWNPSPRIEFFTHAHYSSVGEVNLSATEFDADTSTRVGMMWYFFEDLGLGLDYLEGQVDTTSISMRFSFGDLRVQ
jgi:hypothetical protein